MYRDPVFQQDSLLVSMCFEHSNSAIDAVVSVCGTHVVVTVRYSWMPELQTENPSFGLESCGRMKCSASTLPMHGHRPS